MNDYWKVITSPDYEIIKYGSRFFKIMTVPKERCQKRAKILEKNNHDGVTVIYSDMNGGNMLLFKYPKWPFETVQIYDIWGMGQAEYKEVTIDSIDLLSKKELKYVKALYGELK